MRVSVVIPVKDDPRVRDCVRSIRDARRGHEAQVVVVDNGSAPEFEDCLGQLELDGVLVVRAEGTVYAARNVGVRCASGDAILFTDADCLVHRDWIEKGLEALSGDLEVAQGYSGSLGSSLVDRLIQGRYDAQWRGTAPGGRVLCDTRNLAVHRRVLEKLGFEERYRRVGDTEFGLRAEVMGFRVGYAPAMAARHAHDRALDVFVAKQVCHGWGAQRLMTERPGLPWSGHLRQAARYGPTARQVPGTKQVGRIAAFTTIRLARLLEGPGSRLPFRAGLLALAALDKAAGLAGHLMYRPEDPEPSPSSLLGRRLPRD